MPFFYFISPHPERPQEFKDGWFTQMPSTEEVVLPDRLYRTTDCAKIDGDVEFTIHVGRVEKDLKKKKVYKVSIISKGIKFFFDKEYGFIESETDSLNNAVHIFSKLLMRPAISGSSPTILFID